MEAPQTKILIVDDEPSVRSAISDYLSREGFHVLEAGDGVGMRRVLNEHAVAIVLLDVMLPGEDGLSLAQSLADRQDVGVIMISALGSEADRIAGLEFGADDYLPKPVSPRELLARIRALQRRFRGAGVYPPGGLRFEFAGWQLDAVRRVLRDPGGVVTSLSDGEFGLLLAFVEHPQRVLSRDELLHLARGSDSDAFDRAIDTQVSRLRQKLHGATGDEVIRTLRGEGYMFLPAVSLATASDASLPTASPGTNEIRIDSRACEASVGGRRLDLTFSEFALLAVLVEAKGEVVEKDPLSRQVLGRPWRSFDRSIDVHVSNLRNKLSLFPAISIETIRRVGYKLVTS
ncbi:winged-helix domain-containing protein [bacterium]|nr:MAG: winged-helix domain-containing protein [bacterium]